MSCDYVVDMFAYACTFYLSISYFNFDLNIAALTFSPKGRSFSAICLTSNFSRQTAGSSYSNLHWYFSSPFYFKLQLHKNEEDFL